MTPACRPGNGQARPTLTPIPPTIDDTFRALADPHRRAIIERLSRGPAPVSELARPLPITLSATVQHVNVLEASGLLQSSKVGRIRTCRIGTPALAQLETWVATRRQQWELRLDRLGDALAEQDGA